MAEQTLQAVRLADDRERAARQQADELVAKAKSDADAHIKEVCRQATEQAQRAVQAAREQGDAMLEQAQANAREREQALAQQAQQRRQDAVRQVIDCILS